MTDLVQHQQNNDLETEMSYARAVTSGGRASSILPDVYKDNPANALIAIGLGRAMGLSPAESLYRIAVIKGKPSASAELIAANVRKAGHRLRVRGDETTCTATIIRADDPEFPFEVTRDLDWAKGMGLAGNDNYRKQPGTMLQWRAITAVARLACPEALYGVSYTPDEARDLPDEHTAPRVSADDFAPADPQPVVMQPDAEPQQPETDVLTAAQSKKMHALFGKLLDGDRAAGLKFASDVTGREVLTTKTLTKAEATAVIDALVKEEQAGSAAEPTDTEPEPFDGSDPWAQS